MGYRLHVAKKYEVEYALGDAFNYKCEEFHNLLGLFGAEYTGESWDEEFDVPKNDWQKVIDGLKNIYNLNEDVREEIEGALQDLGDTREQVISDMEYFLRNADPNHDYLHLCFF